MTRTRRGLLLLALVTVTVVGSMGSSAQATFADSARVTQSSMSIATVVVDAPDIVNAALDCTRSGATMSMTWSKSTSARVAGYVVKVYFSDGFVQTEPILGANTTSWSKPISLFNATNYALQYTVTAQTDYNWTAESPKTGTFQC
jgi:hypothetical protein